MYSYLQDTMVLYTLLWAMDLTDQFRLSTFIKSHTREYFVLKNFDKGVYFFSHKQA